MENLRKEHRDLEMKVMRKLRDAIEASEYLSTHTGEKAIRVNVFDYIELSIINDRLTFMDINGYEYSLYSDMTLEDLIDLL